MPHRSLGGGLGTCCLMSGKNFVVYSRVTACAHRTTFRIPFGPLLCDVSHKKSTPSPRNLAKNGRLPQITTVSSRLECKNLLRSVANIQSQYRVKNSGMIR